MQGSGAGLKSTFPGAKRGVVLKCPMHAPFLSNLAAAVTNGSIWNRGAPEPHELPRLTIYLPTHASVTPLKLALLALSPNGAAFLPRIRVLGDADPLDLFAAYGTRIKSVPAALELLKRALSIPPAFDELERQVQLAALVIPASQSLKSTRLEAGEPLFTAIPPASAFVIAGQIAALIAESYTEGADLSRIALLDSSRASGSEQLSLQLLRGVWRGWQAHKAKALKLDREERRNRLMEIEAEFIRHSDTPVIIAGSTGSVAATVGLMEAALSRPQSAVVLYGLDDNADALSWDAAGAHPEHPQHGLHQLLTRLNIGVADIGALPVADTRSEFRPPHSVSLPKGREDAAAPSPAMGEDGATPSPPGERAGVRGNCLSTSGRAKFLSESLRPAPATAEWAGFIERMKAAASPAPGLYLLEADSIQDEADVIALIFRESFEVPGQTAALVTPSDSLLARVRHALAKWGPEGDPRAGGASENILAARALSCAASGKPEDFVELLRYAAGSCGEIARLAEIADLGVLRQMWRPSSLQGIPAALSRAEQAISSGEARHPSMTRIAAAEWDAARALATKAIEALSPLNARPEKRRALPDWIAAHRLALAKLASLGVLSGGAGLRPASALCGLEQPGAASLSLDLAEYASFFLSVVATRREQFHGSPHPRLFLWKPLDARLLTADIVVLGGLNEGCWPHAPGPDPWLNRGDRAFAGLPPPERRTGQTAHDFAALAASAPRVILTRAKKENGSLTRPSRWVSRIKALAAGAGKLAALSPERPWLDWIAARRAPAHSERVCRPRPMPPLAARPRRLSVTAVETWLANPYAIHARHILGLDPLRHPGEAGDARDKGILYHAALHSFFQSYPDALPENAADMLLRKLDKAAMELGFNLENAPFWRPRFARFAAWFAQTEGELRAEVQTIKSEVGGKLRVEGPAGPFEITARADRIDRLAGGALRIYDFKTSANAAKVSAARGAPQLALEGLLAREGAFAGIAAGSSAELFYIVATGGEPPGEIVALRLPAAEAINAAQAGTLGHIARFDNETAAYEYQTRAIFRDKSENDPYAHLARVKEWSAEAEDDEAGDE